MHLMSYTFYVYSSIISEKPEELGTSLLEYYSIVSYVNFASIICILNKSIILQA